MDFVVNSDPVVHFAFLSGLGAVVLTLLLIVRITLLRLAYRRRERRKRKFLADWQDLLNESMLASPGSVELPVVWRMPEIAPQDVIFFLSLWNHLQSSVRGTAQERLNALARTLGMDEAARRMLQKGSDAEKLLAIISLCHLGNHTDVIPLKELLGSNQPIACLHAARALLCIDPHMLGDLLPILVRRDDVSTAAIVSTLKGVGAEITSPVLAEMLRQSVQEDSTAQHMIRLITLTVAAYPQAVHLSLRMIIDRTEDPGVLAACLKTMRAPDDLVKIRHFVSHPNWRVRVHAISALGDMGESKDLDTLKALLSDSHWWVRYRAAQAISHLPFVSTDDMENMKKQLTDNFAINMLTQVISEQTA